MPSLQPLVIVGAGGHGREVLDVVEAVGGYRVLGFVDDGSPDEALLSARGQRLLGGRSELDDLAATAGWLVVVVGIGDAGVRARVVAGLPWGRVRSADPLVHPDATVGSRCSLGEGTVVAAGARLTTNVTVGAHCYVGPNAAIGHDVVMEDAATIYPGAVLSGNVHVGRAATVGAGAAVRQGLLIGDGAMVGLGAAVVTDVPPGATVIGVPARQSGE